MNNSKIFLIMITAFGLFSIGIITSADDHASTRDNPTSGTAKTGLLAPKSEPKISQSQFPIATTAPTPQAPLVGEQIKWQVISSGGINGSSVSYRLNATVGQTATGSGSSASYKLAAGFWQNFASSCCLKPGDANNDTKVNVGDAVFMINYVFKAGTPPACKDQADANHDCKLNVGDAVFLINYVFKGGSAPQCGCVGP